LTVEKIGIFRPHNNLKFQAQELSEFAPGSSDFKMPLTHSKNSPLSLSLTLSLTLPLSLPVSFKHKKLDVGFCTCFFVFFQFYS